MPIIPFEIVSIENDGYHILVDVELFDKKFKMVIDTGASKTVLDEQTLRDVGIAEHDLISSDILSTGLGTNEMKSHILSLESLTIHNWVVKDIQVAVLDLSAINYAYRKMNLPPIIGVLGGDILLSYNAIINYKKNTLRLNNRRRRTAST